MGVRASTSDPSMCSVTCPSPCDLIPAIRPSLLLNSIPLTRSWKSMLSCWRQGQRARSALAAVLCITRLSGSRPLPNPQHHRHSTPSLTGRHRISPSVTPTKLAWFDPVKKCPNGFWNRHQIAICTGQSGQDRS